MPQLPVRCPRCDADLTVGREHLNRPVGCGACGRSFVPVADPGGREPDDEPARRRGGFGPTMGILSVLLGVGTLLSCCITPVTVVLGLGAIATGVIGLFIRDSRRLAIAGLALVLLAAVIRGVIGFSGVF